MNNDTADYSQTNNDNIVILDKALCSCTNNKNQRIGYGEHSLNKLNTFYNNLCIFYCYLTMLGLTMYVTFIFC